jgi:putative transposase
MSPAFRLAMIARPHPHYSIVQQCQLLKVPRSTLYYKRKPANEGDLALTRRIDELYLKWPFYGSRRLVAELRGEGHCLNRKHVRRLIQPS